MAQFSRMRHIFQHCWLDQENLKIGDKFREKIDEAIRIYDKLLIILSENSIGSDWVEDEVEAAFENWGKWKGLAYWFWNWEYQWPG